MGTEAMDQAIGLAMAGSSEARNYARNIRKSNYGKKLHARNEHLDAVQGAKGQKKQERQEKALCLLRLRQQEKS